MSEEIPPIYRYIVERLVDFDMRKTMPERKLRIEELEDFILNDIEHDSTILTLDQLPPE